MEIRYEHRVLAGRINVGVDVELRVRLFDDGQGVGVDGRCAELIERAIEQTLNETVVTKLVSIEEALPPGPRKIVVP